MKPWIIAVLLAKSLDVGSTCLALSKGKVEQNPVLPNSCVGQVAVQGTFAAIAAVGIAQLYPEHPRVVKVIGSIAVGSGSVAVVINLKR